jgi:hypothetical protein
MGRTMSKIFGIEYGPCKTGKTLAAVRAFPDALFIAPRGALLCAKWLAWEPQVIEADAKMGIKQMIEVINKAGKKYPAIIIDDFSILCDVELSACKKKHPGWSAFDVFNNRVYDLRDAARMAPCHVILTMHEQPPKEVKNGNKWLPGSPLIPGWQLPEKLPAMADFVARIVYDEEATGWPYLYQVGPDKNYITGDRLAIMPDKFPLNLREALIAADIEVPRPEALAWMDPVVDQLADKINEELAKGKDRDVKGMLRHAFPQLQEKIPEPRHIRWVFADALDRAYLRRHNNNLVDAFIHSL